MATLPHRFGWSFVFCALLAAAFLSPARAEPVTFAFRGTVTGVQAQQGAYRTTVVNWPAVGSTIAGTYTFESTAPDSAAQPNQGLYYNPPPAGPIDISMGDFRWFGPASAISIFDNQGGSLGDSYEADDWIPSLEIISPPGLARPSTGGTSACSCRATTRS